MFGNIRATFENLRKSSENGRKSSKNRQKPRNLYEKIISPRNHVLSSISQRKQSAREYKQWTARVLTQLVVHKVIKKPSRFHEKNQVIFPIQQSLKNYTHKLISHWQFFTQCTFYTRHLFTTAEFLCNIHVQFVITYMTSFCITAKIEQTQVELAYRLALGGQTDSQVYSQVYASCQKSHFNASARAAIQYLR